MKADRPHVGYRITVELNVGPQGKTLTLTGETPDYRRGDGVTDADVCALAANALLWQSSALAGMATDHARLAKMARALNLPLNQVPY